MDYKIINQKENVFILDQKGASPLKNVDACHLETSLFNLNGIFFFCNAEKAK